MFYNFIVDLWELKSNLLASKNSALINYILQHKMIKIFFNNGLAEKYLPRIVIFCDTKIATYLWPMARVRLLVDKVDSLEV